MIVICLILFGQLVMGLLSIEVKGESDVISFLKIIFDCTSTAFFEEFIFRLLLVNFLLRLFNKSYLICVLSSVLFALAHSLNSHFTTIALISHFFGGIIYSYAYLKTKGIWLPFGLHFGWNFTQDVLGMPVSGSPSHSFLSTTFYLEDFWQGGLYGFEGGIISCMARAILLLCLINAFKSKFLQHSKV